MREIQSLRNDKLLNYFPMVLGIISGFSVFYFLYFFGAYGIQKGISYSGHSHFFRSSCFGLLTFGYLTVFEMLIKPKITITSIRDKVLWYISLVILGSQFIFILFNYFWNWQEWNVEAYLLIVKEFPLMMVMPFTFYLIVERFVGGKKEKTNYIVFKSENNKDQLKIKIEDFLYVNSSGNYITVCYATNNTVKEHLIRKTLKFLEKELVVFSKIKRCHRSYLINTSNIQTIKEIKGKVFAEMKGVRVPVSKQYQNQFL
ncbi:LytR/AlgR family response regulator transcription factor [Tenacibaculum agarivorans]|uniref:LytR/AlgR family response regulator transcription factor n=1 Tax=Tenacibaculum agarivorans TaxID=1908389 RepID=UPI00094B8B5D|nr:LytTR family DNA-binding domain-containing protein [Tenacibaculum agarivorans]